MLLLDDPVGVGWSIPAQVRFPAPLRGGRPDPGACDHRAAQGERVRQTLVLCPRSGISVQRESGVRYCPGTGRRRRLRAAPPLDDLKIDSTHRGGSRAACNCPLMNREGEGGARRIC